LIEESNYFSFTFFILGAIVGAFTALLYTPDTGENNRKKLAEKFNDLNEDKEKNIGKKSYKIREITDSGVRNLEEERENLTQF
jgi:gas vesicle protein